MSDTIDKFEGRCLCGAVRFTATGQPGIYWCHCESCRRHTGAPVSVFVAFERAAYTVTQGEITKFDSTPGRTTRGFCGRCGSTLTCETVGLPTETHFHVGAFDRAGELRPTRHFFAEEHLPWFPMATERATRNRSFDLRGPRALCGPRRLLPTGRSKSCPTSIGSTPAFASRPMNCLVKPSGSHLH